ncbi:MAG TPA: hypothetical protein VIW69_16530 [Candidatus Elarobacter sp.]
MLAIYGDADFVTDEADHRRIADIVNGVHPGNAKLDVIPGIDRYLVSAAVATWLCERERCTESSRVPRVCRNPDTFLPRA